MNKFLENFNYNDSYGSTNAIKSIGVGNPNMDASAKAQINNAHAPHIVFTHCKLQVCNLLNQSFIQRFPDDYETY
ncbi:MAG: hypothetical protein NT144_12420 [Bacteroidia bacterium]|nr:hypothetical protein [Bacteroidia bacterium]